jgi:hypothetical protein
MIRAKYYLLKYRMIRALYNSILREMKFVPMKTNLIGRSLLKTGWT